LHLLDITITITLTVGGDEVCFAGDPISEMKSFTISEVAEAK
jgi:hypothetical protein